MANFPAFPSLALQNGFEMMDDHSHVSTISWAFEACERGNISLVEFRAMVSTIVKMRTTCAYDLNSETIAKYGVDCIAYCESILSKE